ncbi:MAG TPA: putative LPS assembly protein LptD [Saprospiraceae bacterium]|nr:putative LPS assembly protein LptD [Saprospiraceae bacterium]
MNTLVAQIENPLLKVFPEDSAKIKAFSEDTSRIRNVNIVMSADSLDAKVEYGSVDSNYLDNKTHKVYLFGKAYVRYKELSIKADYIVVNLDSSIAIAEGRLDSLGHLTGKPEFNMGDENFTAERLRYNFKTRRGFIYNVITKESDLFIHGDETKFVSGGSDSLHQDDVLYNKGALITTCTADHPHYGIRASKVKTIPDKLAVIGPSHLEIFGVPTPLWLPFGFYPISNTRSAGVIFPRDYENSPTWGFGLKGLGYYFPIKDWADMQVTGDIYFNGSWGINLNSNYVRKYKFRGNINLGYSNRITEASNTYLTTNSKSFIIRLTHNQDAKSNPYQTIGGSINIQTNDYQSLNHNDAQSALTTSYSSNFSYSRIFPNKPYSLTASFNHSQNTRSHQVTINAPDLNFRLNRIYPFKSKKKAGPDQWYEKIAFQYTGSARSQIIGTDTTLFDNVTWANAQWGAQHKASANVNFNVLKYFNFTPSVDYGETWFFKTRERSFRFDPNDTLFVRQDSVFFPDGMFNYIQPDTINFGEVDPTLVSGFQAFRSISGSINMNTQLFGTLQFKKGWLRGIRHVIKPNVGFSYTPKSPETYFQNQRFSVLYIDSLRRFSRFDNLLYSVQPVTVEQANLNYSITNLFEAKYYSKKDSTEKKLKLFDNINVSGSYNMAAKYFKWSPLSISGNTRFFKGITTATVNASYSFYGRINSSTLDTMTYLKTDHKLLRFENLRLRFSSHITFKQILELFNGKPPESTQPTGVDAGDNKKLPVKGDKFFELLSNFQINHELGIIRTWRSGRDSTSISTNSVNLVGSIQLTPNWSINFGNIGYDFKSKQLTYPDIGIARDLHCWQLSFSFQPTRGTYAFHLGVKPGSFDFLKFPYNRGNYDSFGF